MSGGYKDMEQEQLFQLITQIKENKYESTQIELKSSKEGNSKQFYDTLSSFSNTSGGIIIFGIDEKNDFDVCGVKDVQTQQNVIQELCKAMEPVVRPTISVCEYIKGVFVIACEVNEMDYIDKPCYYRPLGIEKGSFIRTGNGDEHMTEMEIQQFVNYKRKIKSELDTFPETINESRINQIQLSDYIAKESEQKANFSMLPLNIVKEMLGLEKGGNITLASLLNFGIYPQEVAPMMSVNCVKVDGNEYISENNINERFAANVSCAGTIKEMFYQAMNFVKNNIQIKVVVNKDGYRQDDEEYPLIAIREALLNALIHRDYSEINRNIPVSLTIFNNRIEITNPGSILGNYRVEDLGLKYLPIRNPFIARIVEVLMGTENRHSGIMTINAALKSNKQLPALFESSKGFFKVTIYKERIDDEKVKAICDEALSYCRKPRSKESIAEHFGYSSTRASYFFTTYIKPLIVQGILFYTIPEKPESKYQKIVSIREY